MQTHPFFHWSVENRHGFLYAFIALALLVVIGLSFTSRRATQAESNYLLAENYLTILQKSIPGEPGTPSLKAEGVLSKLEQITQAYPELHSKYDGAIAQFLLLQKDDKEAFPFTKRILERVQPDQLPSYTLFTEITLLIGEARYQEALVQSELLQKKLLDDTRSSSQSAEKYPKDFLFAYNLLRKALLYKQTGQKENEQAAWEEWQQYSKADVKEKQLIDPANFANLKNMLKEGHFSLDQYIVARERELGIPQKTPSLAPKSLPK